MNFAVSNTFHYLSHLFYNGKTISRTFSCSLVRLYFCYYFRCVLPKGPKVFRYSEVHVTNANKIPVLQVPVLECNFWTQKEAWHSFGHFPVVSVIEVFNHIIPVLKCKNWVSAVNRSYSTPLWKGLFSPLFWLGVYWYWLKSPLTLCIRLSQPCCSIPKRRDRTQNWAWDESLHLFQPLVFQRFFSHHKENRGIYFSQ